MKTFLTIKEIKEKLEKKEINNSELVDFYINRIKKYNSKINAVLETFDKNTLNINNNTNTLLNNIPGVLKDNICQKNQIASCGSKILQNFRATYDATVTERIKNHGGIILGRANCDEFAMGGTGEFSAYGPTYNPWDLERVPGGSSSGSASAVAASLVPWALGTETGGSVRGPAAWCNLVGLYPTYGTHSRYGVVAFASSSDQVGPLTKTVYDNALISTALSGHDPKDSRSLLKEKIDFTHNLTGKLPENLTLGILQDSIESESVDPQIKEKFLDAIKVLEKLGAKIKYVNLPNLKYGISVYFIVSRAEAASNLARFDGSLYGLRNKEAKNLHDMYTQTRHDNLGIEVKQRILTGSYVLSSTHKGAFYDKANHVRCVMRAEFEKTFKDVDLILSPTSPTLPFKMGQTKHDPLTMYMADYFLVSSCMAGVPALSIPCGFSKENLPIGFQFIGPRFSEKLLYQVAYAYEQNTEYHLKNPAGFE
ncbi:Asp-tRNA(Asn)/Glu-tRNA(Gln) amidotransferase subunit GatA [Candidatus Babeliales bacterium]|nr:Asp-tRNA(Asn)/Glu-tRNA(Gln) amidotransferase subunit GatA [Candidatus Babeliales bacterium]MCF7899317.1 Asp-tRNA(Asn)/Glu-tRNA(Gln) amidotransferase subunit GatA [Candidatus Babeliales bacterium]